MRTFAFITYPDINIHYFLNINGNIAIYYSN